MEFHPIANIFPMIEEEKYRELVQDIQANGLHEPICLYEEKVIDGRNRYNACLEIGIEPQYRTYNGPEETLLAFVLSMNKHRRHLTSSQLAMVALEVEKHLAVEAKKRQGARTDLTLAQNCANVGKAAAQAGALLGVSTSYVEQAKRIVQKSPELAQQVFRGELKLPDALERLRTPFSRAAQGLGRSEKQDWPSPGEIIRSASDVMGGIDLDPCADSYQPTYVYATKVYTKGDDGLVRIWRGNVYVNPPYGYGILVWVEKALAEYQSGNAEQVILLLPGGSHDTRWFKLLRDFPMCLVERRLTFGGAPAPASFTSIVVYLGEHIVEFAEVFRIYGPVMQSVIFEGE